MKKHVITPDDSSVKVKFNLTTVSLIITLFKTVSAKEKGKFQISLK